MGVSLLETTLELTAEEDRTLEEEDEDDEDEYKDEEEEEEEGAEEDEPVAEEDGEDDDDEEEEEYEEPDELLSLLSLPEEAESTQTPPEALVPIGQLQSSRHRISLPPVHSSPAVPQTALGQSLKSATRKEGVVWDARVQYAGSVFVRNSNGGKQRSGT